MKLYGQERNLMTSSIARMNCFLHGIEDFRIERGDTLAEPKLLEGDRLMRFDVVLANPPYSIKQWDRDAFASDPWGRNLYGTPPQGRADYAFQQHILQSLKPKTGRCAVLWPHGVLFRQEEDEMRKKMIEADLVEAVIGVGANLFYNASMEACIVICRTTKPQGRRGKILFINAVNEVTRERAQSFLETEHIDKIVAAYRAFKTDAGFATIATLDEVRARGHSLKIDLYVQAATTPETETRLNGHHLKGAMESWDASRISVRTSLADLLGKTVTEAKPVKIGSELLAGFDRSECKRVRFGDVVKQMKEQVDPEADGIERYVAGEHMETENVHIRKWGTVGDGYLGPAFIRGFRKGQVLYGSRRTYLKKVAVAEWAGVTANTTFVLETVKEKMLQELLPWLMLSERFTKHSVQESKGSTNPYINYPDIAKFEFDFPPLDQQRRIAEILWAVDEVQTKWQDAANQHAVSLRVVSSSATLLGLENRATQQTSIGAIPRNWRCLRLEDVVESSAYGPRFPGSSYAPDGNAFQVRTTDYDRVGGINFSQVPAAKLDANVVSTHRLKDGDFLLSRSGEYAGLTAVFREPRDGRDYVPGAFLIRYRLTDDLDPDFLIALCESEFGDRYVKPLATGSAQPNISGSAFGRLLIPVPPVGEQREILSEIRKLQTAGARLREHATQTRSLLTGLLNSIN